MDSRILYWCACQRCNAVITSTDLAEIIRLFARHEYDDHANASPHYPNAGSTTLTPEETRPMRAIGQCPVCGMDCYADVDAHVLRSHPRSVEHEKIVNRNRRL